LAGGGAFFLALGLDGGISCSVHVPHQAPFAPLSARKGHKSGISLGVHFAVRATEAPIAAVAFPSGRELKGRNSTGSHMGRPTPTHGGNSMTSPSAFAFELPRGRSSSIPCSLACSQRE
jgi:hypothetical protein